MPCTPAAALSDEFAERYWIALTLHQCRAFAPDPVWFQHEGRRSLFIAGMILGAKGYLYPVDEEEKCDRPVIANAQLVANAVLSAGVWSVAGNPLDEIAQCLACCTLPIHGSYYASLLQTCHKRRQRLQELEEEMRMLLGGAA